MIVIRNPMMIVELIDQVYWVNDFPEIKKKISDFFLGFLDKGKFFFFHFSLSYRKKEKKLKN